MTIHIGKHSFETFQCKFCQRSFHSYSHFKSHEHNHDGEKLFKCKKCNYSSDSVSALKYHINTHRRENPYKLDIPSVADFFGDRKMHNLFQKILF